LGTNIAFFKTCVTCVGLSLSMGPMGRPNTAPFGSMVPWCFGWSPEREPLAPARRPEPAWPSHPTDRARQGWRWRWIRQKTVGWFRQLSCGYHGYIYICI
jgi:hypothetical protein